MVLRSLDAQSIIFITLLLSVYFLSAIFNGFFQAAYAKLLGDDTAENNGFLSLNPLVYIDLIGMIALFFIGIGWSKSVPFDSNVVKGPLRKLKIAFFYAMEVISRICLALIAKLFLVSFLPFPLNVIRDITYKGFQSHGDLIAQGYSSWIILLGMFNVHLIFFNVAMATLRFVFGGFRLFFNYIARLIGIDTGEIQEILFLLLLIGLFIFDNQISYMINVVYSVALYYLFGN